MSVNIINKYLAITQLTFKFHPHPSNQYALQEKQHSWVHPSLLIITSLTPVTFIMHPPLGNEDI